MAVSIARVPTENGSKYLQQLCKHWSHRFSVEFTPEKGMVPFGSGDMLELMADKDGVTLQITKDDPSSDLARLENVVEEHLKRFAFREELVFDWTRQ